MDIIVLNLLCSHSFMGNNTMLSLKEGAALESQAAK